METAEQKSKHEAHVAQYKKETVDALASLMKEYSLVAVVNMENLPAPQLKDMRAKLRGGAVLKMTKKNLIKLAIQRLNEEKKNIAELEHYVGGMPALLFSKDNPFRLSKLLKKNRSPAPAKPGQIAPNDIVVSKGPTPFAPGPIIAELAVLGIKSGVEAGKVAIKEDKLVAKKGEKIKPNVAALIARLGIMPMEIGLDLVAVYENGTVYTKDILDIDEKDYIQRLEKASVWAFNLAMYSSYTTKQTMPLLIGKAFKEAQSVGVSARIFDEGIIELLVARAEMQMASLKDTAGIAVESRPKIEEKSTEVKKASDLEVPSRKELEENIKRREKEREVKDVEKLAQDITKKHALGRQS